MTIMAIKFYPNILFSFAEIHNQQSLILTSYGKCFFHCYECHNFDYIFAKKKDFISEETTIEKISLTLNNFENIDIIDNIIISGGEFLFYNIDQILSFLEKIKKFKKNIIIYTNGTYPNKIKTLIDSKLIDGFHLDIKYPLNFYLYFEKIQEVLGINISKKDFFILDEQIIKSANLISEFYKTIPFSQFRTVRYPICDDNYFNSCLKSTYIFREKTNFQLKHKINEFVIDVIDDNINNINNINNIDIIDI